MEKECGCNGNCACASDKTPLNGSSGSAQSTSIRINNLDNDGGFSTGTYIFDPYYPKSVVDVVVNADEIVITYIQRAMYSYTTINNSITIAGGGQQIYNPDKVFKEVYGVKDGKLSLIKTVVGRIVPPTLTESYEFDEE